MQELRPAARGRRGGGKTAPVGEGESSATGVLVETERREERETRRGGSFFALIFSEVHVSIKNRLGSGKNMTLHCQSKDDDLGEQTVEDGGKFGWDFDVNVWGTTLYYCDMGWANL
ncbi:hypothetical protein NL676_031016 [Syzygium grande]|nr:hypothetical protein NL676_031016 [Syzygium grande]